MSPRMRPQKDFLIWWLHHVSQDDGPVPKILCYITMNSTWNKMNFLKYRIDPFQSCITFNISQPWMIMSTLSRSSVIIMTRSPCSLCIANNHKKGNKFPQVWKTTTSALSYLCFAFLYLCPLITLPLPSSTYAHSYLCPLLPLPPGDREHSTPRRTAGMSGMQQV